MNCIEQVTTDRYTAIHGDCVEALRGLPDQSIGYSIFSPPFASLYTYSNSRPQRQLPLHGHAQQQGT